MNAIINLMLLYLKANKLAYIDAHKNSGNYKMKWKYV